MIKIEKQLSSELLNPLHPQWEQVNGIHVDLSPTPIAMQPTKAIRAAFEDKKYGLIEQANFQAVHDGQSVYFRTSWKDAHKDDRVTDNDSFVDQMALMLPLTKNSVFLTMGSMSDPVELWRWKADQETPQQIKAEGVGTTENIQDDAMQSQAVWKDGRWYVVMQRDMVTPSDNSANFIPGEQQRCSLALWAGHNQERGGIKSISMRWIPLDVI